MIDPLSLLAGWKARLGWALALILVLWLLVAWALR